MGDLIGTDIKPDGLFQRHGGGGGSSPPIEYMTQRDESGRDHKYVARLDSPPDGFKITHRL